MDLFAELLSSFDVWLAGVIFAAVGAYCMALMTYVMWVPAVVSGEFRKTLLAFAVITLMCALLSVFIGYIGYHSKLGVISAQPPGIEQSEALLEGQRARAREPLDIALWIAALPFTVAVVGVISFLRSRSKADK